ncbi:hypothetical protein V6N12_069859 [Hibiscus sabdariffa]|uniref:Uncharacterized protein n=1 Tax=Hibiscus sabdariffa TaxID=183260 RepID=A0ABR2FF32_9ROSI
MLYPHLKSANLQNSQAFVAAPPDLLFSTPSFIMRGTVASSIAFSPKDMKMHVFASSNLIFKAFGSLTLPLNLYIHHISTRTLSFSSKNITSDDISALTYLCFRTNKPMETHFLSCYGTSSTKGGQVLYPPPFQNQRLVSYHFIALSRSKGNKCCTHLRNMQAFKIRTSSLQLLWSSYSQCHPSA